MHLWRLSCRGRGVPAVSPLAMFSCRRPLKLGDITAPLLSRSIQYVRLIVVCEFMSYWPACTARQLQRSHTAFGFFFGPPPFGLKTGWPESILTEFDAGLTSSVVVQLPSVPLSDRLRNQER
ncbi:hypothetical protein N656DRAFT_775253 [Canariomyces notabilis]|uniref:Uncharacterized protein n=1 Tax=Canariomyces notabilis TaxID=2074819 RepID=A0AAN6TLY9_9PEZI|nr:hypothetical protein N656DRAFT_775253 [Canariomyces arenarius]